MGTCTVRYALLHERAHAGVAQWQSSSLPSWLCGFDSRHPLGTSEGAALTDRPLLHVQGPETRQVPEASQAACPLPLRGAAAGPR